LLLALGLEAGVQGIHHHNLVREAEGNMSREIRENRLSLAKELASLPAEKAQLEGLLRSVNDLQYGRGNKFPQGMRWATIGLSDSAWSTSASSGATAYMGYAEANRYAHVYAMQKTYGTALERYVNLRFQMFGFLTRMNLPDKPSAAEFEAPKAVIGEQIVMNQVLLEIGHTLNAAYDAAPKSRSAE
jgi:hypothetical protein